MKIELCHVRITRSSYIDYVKQFVAGCQRDYSVYTTDEDKARAMAIADYEAAFGSTMDTDEEHFEIEVWREDWTLEKDTIIDQSVTYFE